MSWCGLTCKLCQLSDLLLVRTTEHKVKRVWAEAMDPLGLAGAAPHVPGAAGDVTVLLAAAGGCAAP